MYFAAKNNQIFFAFGHDSSSVVIMASSIAGSYQTSTPAQLPDLEVQQCCDLINQAKDIVENYEQYVLELST